MSEEPEISVRMGVAERLRRFNKALLAEDELGAVIRAHIYIENELIAFIRARSPSSDDGKDHRVSYHKRVNLAASLGLHESFGPSLSFIGKLRNRFAHQLDAVITEQDADDFDTVLGPHKEAVEAAFRAAHDKLGTHETAIPFEKQEPRDRVTLSFVTLWAAMVVAAHKASQIWDQSSEDQDGEGVAAPVV